MVSENVARLRAAWSKEAFQCMIRGFWKARVANGLTSAEDADVRIQEQLDRLDGWYPDPTA